MNSYVQVNHLGKSFGQGDRKLQVLKNINFTIEEGEFVCLIGGSGCGKSTILRLISGLDEEYEGEIFVDGKTVCGTSRERGVIFQEHRLFPWLTVAENIGYSLQHTGKKEKYEIVQSYIDLVGLSGFEKSYPKQLSGGMAQRANIARALVNNPKLLLLDEPFSALDAFTKIALQKEMYRIKEGKKSTMLMVTHDIEEAVYLADKIIMLSPKFPTGEKIIRVDLPRPRDRNSKEFVELKKILFDNFFSNTLN
jgi:sulfonate transport system ATP-binding protein